MNDKQPLFGIVGGMGTAAGLEIQELIAETFYAKGQISDQDYPEWIYANASKAPDRTAAIKGDGNSPADYISEILVQLKLSGADAVLVACNTAHAFHEEIFRKVDLPWIHLQNETAKYLARKGIKQAGILATDGTIIRNLFSKAFRQLDLNAVEPEPSSEIQQKVMSAIYDPTFGIKFTGTKVSEEAKVMLFEVIDQMDVDNVIAGCTELSVAFSQMDMRVNYFDPMKIAAGVVYDLYTGIRDLTSLKT